jgi:hypothetical protein
MEVRGAVEGEAGAWLRSQLGRAKRDIVVVTPWFSGSPVMSILRAIEQAPGDVRLRFIFRWPQERSDLWFLDASALMALAADTRVTLEFVNDRLHAKVYVVDDRALVTSANLTSAGLDSNIELGTVVGVGEVRDWIDGLPTERLTETACEDLLQRIANAGSNPGAEAEPPPPTMTSADFVRSVMSSAGIQRVVRIPTGMGQNAWHAPLFRRTQAVVKAQISDAADGEQFHFAITKADHRRMRDNALHGYLFVRTDPDELRTPSDGPALVLVPATLLIQPHRGVAASAFGKSGKLTVYVERSGSGWTVRIPGAGKGREATGKLVRDRRWEGAVYRLPAWDVKSK